MTLAQQGPSFKAAVPEQCLKEHLRARVVKLVVKCRECH